ncbi:lytic transglycosylase domain-containing protein [Accumulibacter sp.]|uniref:lytic transglycosylase domain-containing protein n=1 Tax=Accumulibacter sp. TaxID=2053492 RepID=UPI0025E58E9C|nr:lytic transglycosylase domain-containing protein [Accumulibacter sp.]MCM8611079.1 lytic transglycosylase domain-containing protein [Accumulibacter sp.]MCM8636193.1 lytic transglycosylase domain-containing protein [Accumulibacter sp.]MCM8640592.1 lytic transglycosylase domain-containing protein [Accumulibacter sp.]
MRCLIALAALLLPLAVHAGAQKYEPLSASVRAALSRTVSDRAPPRSSFTDSTEAIGWLSEMSQRLEKRMPDRDARLDFLRAVHYEATRAGLDPQLVLGLIQVESGFKKYAVSTAGARGFMQVMPFWVRLVGGSEDNLFHLRTNLRYGCTILRHYLDIERGDLYRALGRYNGSLGQPQYPNMVRAAWQTHWSYNKRNLAMR